MNWINRETPAEKDNIQGFIIISKSRFRRLDLKPQRDSINFIQNLQNKTLKKQISVSQIRLNIILNNLLIVKLQTYYTSKKTTFKILHLRMITTNLKSLASLNLLHRHKGRVLIIIIHLITSINLKLLTQMMLKTLQEILSRSGKRKA